MRLCSRFGEEEGVRKALPIRYLVDQPRSTAKRLVEMRDVCYSKYAQTRLPCCTCAKSSLQSMMTIIKWVRDVVHVTDTVHAYASVATLTAPYCEMDLELEVASSSRKHSCTEHVASGRVSVASCRLSKLFSKLWQRLEIWPLSL